MEVALLFALILLNGVFAMSEIALLTVRKARLQKAVEDGDLGAAAAVQLNENPTQFLSTIQIGITSISILNGIVGEAVFAEPLGRWLESMGVDGGLAHILATGLVVVVVTYFSIVLGELVPKRLGQINAEPIARLVARPMMALTVGTKFFVRILGGSTDLILGTIGARNLTNQGVTEEEIKAMLEEGSESGVIEEQEHAMVRNVFRLDDRQIASLMVPRGDIVYLDSEADYEETLQRIEGSEHSRFPVVKGDLNEIIGILSVRHLLGKSLRGEAFDLRANLQPPVYVPESLTGMELLENFKASGVHLAFVIDEYGELLGMVTLQDLLEAITGEFKPRHAEDTWGVRRDDGSWLLDGIIPIPEMKDRLELKAVPEEERERYHTLSGMMMLLLGRLPRVGDKINWSGWEFEIVDMDDKRIDKVLASPRPETEATAE
ncbi:MAG: HlyC/CorC family transporter [Betaproteobacteria bacterium]|nr:HlyC/CorC family transporter [Betaproteobacteria bacterium]